MFTVKVNGEPVATLDVDPVLVKSVKMKSAGGYETSVLAFHEDSVDLEFEYRNETDLDVASYRRTRTEHEETAPDVHRVTKAEAAKIEKEEAKADPDHGPRSTKK